MAPHTRLDSFSISETSLNPIRDILDSLHMSDPIIDTWPPVFGQDTLVIANKLVQDGGSDLDTDLEELDFDLTKNGLMMLCQTEKGLEEEAKVSAMAKEVGVEAEVCDAKRVGELDPNRYNIFQGIKAYINQYLEDND